MGTGQSIEVIPAIRIHPDRNGLIRVPGYAMKSLCVPVSEALYRLSILDSALIAASDLPEFDRLWDTES